MVSWKEKKLIALFVSFLWNFCSVNIKNTELIIYLPSCVVDDLWVLQSSGDQNYERIQFTVTADNFRFRALACSDVWVTISKIPGDYAVSRWVVLIVSVQLVLWLKLHSKRITNHKMCKNIYCNSILRHGAKL